MQPILLLLALIGALSSETAFAQKDPTPSYTFAVRIVGHGKPMILIPGYNGSPDTYNEVVAHFKDSYTCYVVTLAGFAGQPVSGSYDHLLQRQRDDIIRYIVDHHLDHPVIVGFSFGGSLALWIATTIPKLIGQFIDIDGTPFDAALSANSFNKDSLVRITATKYSKALTYTPDDWKRRDSLFHTDSAIKADDPWMHKIMSDSARIAEILVWDKASDFRSSVLMQLETDTLDLTEAVARIRTPILVLGSWVSWDYASKDAGIKDYKRAWAKASNTTIVFSDHGKHFLMYEDLTWLTTQMDAFLRKNP
jgi:N-formylmaleamate deformylase